MDEFSFFFTFYGLLLGLAAAELLGGLGGYVRARPLRSLDPQTGLLALLMFLVICATWLDAWTARGDFALSLTSLWAPIGLATCYYLVATVVLPRNEAQFDQLSIYLAKRKGFIVATMLVAEVFAKVTFVPLMAKEFVERPAVFWIWHVGFNAAILAGWTWLWLARGRRGAIAAIVLLIALYTLPYWTSGSVSGMIGHAWGY